MFRYKYICYEKCAISSTKWKTKIDSICKQKITRGSKELFHNMMHIIKSKAELATTRIKRLLELISSYSFNLHYIKGKDMILSDFLSRQKHDDSNPHEIIPISFNMHSILHDRCYSIGNSEKYLVWK